MQLSRELQMLLDKEVPRMTPSGEKLFRRMLEDAVEHIVRQAFDDKDFEAFNVRKFVE